MKEPLRSAVAVLMLVAGVGADAGDGGQGFEGFVFAFAGSFAVAGDDLEVVDGLGGQFFVEKRRDVVRHGVAGNVLDRRRRAVGGAGPVFEVDVRFFALAQVGAVRASRWSGRCPSPDPCAARDIVRGDGFAAAAVEAVGVPGFEPDVVGDLARDQAGQIGRDFGRRRVVLALGAGSGRGAEEFRRGRVFERTARDFSPARRVEVAVEGGRIRSVRRSSGRGRRSGPFLDVAAAAAADGDEDRVRRFVHRDVGGVVRAGVDRLDDGAAVGVERFHGLAGRYIEAVLRPVQRQPGVPVLDGAERDRGRVAARGRVLGQRAAAVVDRVEQVVVGAVDRELADLVGTAKFVIRVPSGWNLLIAVPP